MMKISENFGEFYFLKIQCDLPFVSLRKVKVNFVTTDWFFHFWIVVLKVLLS